MLSSWLPAKHSPNSSIILSVLHRSMSLGLYIHLPFCRVHCTYCPFAISTDLAWQERYSRAIIREIEAATPAPLETVYLGGGTPSRSSLESLGSIFDAVHSRFEIIPGAEVSMEANPEDVTSEALSAWRALGITRLSIGVQSFDDRELTAIGRIHGRARAIEAVQAATGTGLRTNLDLILGLPGQTRESFAATLETAIGLGAGHLSLYMLDLEERTPLQVQVSRGRVSLPEDETTADLYMEAIERLGSAGLRQYEVSNFAREGEQCMHNLRYWDRKEYLGFGMAAHSFVDEERFANVRDIRAYVERSPAARDFNESLGPGEILRETILLGMRQTSGMCYEDLVRLCRQEGIEWIERGTNGGWLKRVGGRVAFTPEGFLQSNELISQLF